MTNQLPAYLQTYQTRDIGQTLSQNLGSAMPPHVSIAGGRFTLVDASNNELPGAWFDQKLGVYIDACIIDVNEHLSRVYFSGPFDPNAEGVRPDCFSDNGVGPSTAASSPQAATCQPDPTGTFGCKWAVWGSKVSQLGKSIPACSQKQKIALLISGYDIVFLLAVPPNSHGPLREYVNLCKTYNVSISDIFTRIYFKAGELGTLMFGPAVKDGQMPYIDEPTARLRQAAYSEKKTDALVGRTDVARPAIAPPVQTSGQMQVAQNVPNPPQQAGTGTLMPPTIQPGQGHTTQQVQQPGPFGVASTAANQSINTGLPSSNTGPAPGVQTTSPSEAPAGGRRRRRTAAEMQAAQQPNGGTPQVPFPVQGQGATQAIPQQVEQTGQAASFGIGGGQPAAANPELAGMLDDFFKS
jgi:hypothetical protein